MSPTQPTKFFVAGRDDEDDKDTLLCKCGCSFLELIEVKQYPKFYQVILGQVPAPKSDPFYIFRCPKCQEIYEPQIAGTLQDKRHKLYSKFLKQMKD